MKFQVGLNKILHAIRWRYYRYLKPKLGFLFKLLSVISSYFEVHPVKVIENKVSKNPVEHLVSNFSNDQEIVNDFALIRIIGNDLYPRHKLGQTRENLDFILKNEGVLDRAHKVWVVNRIFSPEERAKIIDLLEFYAQEYIEIPFLDHEYKRVKLVYDKLSTDNYLLSDDFASLDEIKKARILNYVYKDKNKYVMNNNGARNLALTIGKRKARWVLPFDGNCFFTADAWSKLVAVVDKEPWRKHFVVPMARMLSNELLLKDDRNIPEALEEPQIMFRADTHTEFNPEFYYGRRPKVELFWVLGIPGKWDKWTDDEFDEQRRSLSSEANSFGVAGWVARLFSGMPHLEKTQNEASRSRYVVRQTAILETLKYLDSTIK